ncbi:ATP synthase subunit gamma, mitochondrial-like isoform X2 [Fopius arisanus]|uniref:F-ATPase gamma subunit n=1 Tax=Fopius arisanus TaxID=64838 RepID=A0A9R1TM91_9HYME|nr:PREDICTED: ATP synthase subunit gamma, mitochondrial-like isoform X2 [Fopius arisanus]
MSSLKVIKNRIKSVENTKKISRTMRLVSAAKYVKAERDLSCARTLGTSPQYFFEAAGLKVDLQPKSRFINPNVSIVSTIDLFDRLSIISAPKFVLYDGLDDNTVDCWVEFTFATIIYLVLKESSVAEHAARMTAMDNATKNASEMIKKLQLKFNRTRQAAITAELNEIISGASAIR